jgi:hypothetical protein
MAVWGWERSVDFASYNLMAYGNFGGTAFLFVIRILYLLGFFGQGPAAAKGKGKML